MGQREEAVAAKEEAARRRAGLQLKRGRKEAEVRQSLRGLEERISQVPALQTNADSHHYKYNMI